MFRKKSNIGEKIVEKGRSKEIQLLIQQLSEFKDGGPIGLSNLTDAWISSSKIENEFSDVAYIDDPIYGCVTLEPEILSLYHHPIIARLNHIKQLSFAFGYPSATHTRLSHSLGVLHLMEEALTKMFKKNKMYSKSKESHIDLKKTDEADILLKAKTVSLLHDIGHGPFSHTIDRYIGFRKNIPDYADKNFSFEYLQKYLKNPIEKCGLDFEGINEILDKDATKNGINQLISNILDSSLDVDRMDYLSRDSHFSGLPLGEINARRLIEHMAPFVWEDGTITLVYLEDAIPYIKHFLYARNSMYINCYDHPKKLAAECMVVNAMDDLVVNEFKEKIDMDELKLLVDDQLLAFMLINANPDTDCHKLTKAIMAGEIFEELYKLDIGDTDKNEKKTVGGATFLRDFNMKSRKATYIEQVRIQQKSLAEECNLDSDELWKIAIQLPPPEAMSTSEIGIQILRRNNIGFEVVEIGEASPDVQNLFNLIRDERLKIRVFASSTLPIDIKEKIVKKSKQLYETE